MPVIKKLGRDLQVGDRLRFLSKFYPVVGFKPHPGIDFRGSHYPARIAVMENIGGLTVEDEDEHEVLVDEVSQGKDEFASFLTSLLK